MRSKQAIPARDGYESKRYLESVLAGEVVTCEKIKSLARIMIPRIENGYKQWHYDPKLAKRPVEFIERFCCQPSGKKRGTLLVLEPYELSTIELTFGFVDEDNLREFTELLWIMARKNGKTSIGAATALYMLTKDGEFAPQCYAAATSKDQASLTYGSILNMVAQSRKLSKHLRKGIIPMRAQDGLICDANMGYFTPLSSQTRNLDGLNVHFANIDEVAAITNRDTYDLVKQGTGSRDQPLLMEITTNGFERGGLFDAQYDNADKWLKEEIEDDHFLPVIYELDNRSEWKDPSCWIKANPGLGTVKKEKYLEEQVNKAEYDPSYLPTVLTKDFNIPENRAAAWLRFDEAVNHSTFDWREMGFRYCVIGYDASDSVDLTAAKALMMRPDDNHIYEMSMYWIPEDALKENVESGLRKERDNVPYQQWASDGLLRITPGNIIDHRVVFDWMNELRDEFDIWPWAMGYDPWHLTDDAWKDGARAFVGQTRLEEIRQGAKTLSGPMKEIRADFAAQRFVNNDNPIDEWCRMNVAIVTDRNDNILPVKGKGNTQRIDGFMAELDAYITLKRHMDEYLATI